MKKSNLYLIFCLFITLNTFAQDSLRRDNKLYVNFLPMALFDYNPTYMFGIEHKLVKNWSLTEEIGYSKDKHGFLALTDGNDYHNPFKETFKARLELRKYIRIENQSLMGPYLSGDVFFKQVNDRMNRKIGRDCFEDDCDYTENFQYPVRKNVFASNFKFGHRANFTLFSDKSRVYLDFSLGLGIRVIDYMHNNLILPTGSKLADKDTNPEVFWEFGSKTYTRILPNPSLNFRVSYLLK